MPGSNPGYHIAVSFHVFIASSNLWRFLSQLSSKTLTLLNSTGFSILSLSLGLSHVFSWLDWICGCLGRMLQRLRAFLIAWYLWVHDINMTYHWSLGNWSFVVSCLLNLSHCNRFWNSCPGDATRFLLQHHFHAICFHIDLKWPLIVYCTKFKLRKLAFWSLILSSQLYLPLFLIHSLCPHFFLSKPPFPVCPQAKAHGSFNFLFKSTWNYFDSFTQQSVFLFSKFVVSSLQSHFNVVLLFFPPGV